MKLMRHLKASVMAMLFVVVSFFGLLAAAAPASACTTCLNPRLVAYSDVNFDYFPYGIYGPRYAIYIATAGGTQYLYWSDFQVTADPSEWHWNVQYPDDTEQLCLNGVGDDGADVCSNWVTI